MSFLTIVEATPARVLGAFRYLVAHGPLPLDTLAARIWPTTARSETSALDTKLRFEMVEAGLVVDGNEGLEPHPGLPEAVRASPEAAETELPVVLADLVMAGERNADLAHAIAWYLGLDPRTAPGHDATVAAALDADGVGGLTGPMLNAPYGMFEDWVVYLGFGWVQPSADGQTKTRLTPDPTAYLRRVLVEVLPDLGVPVPISTFRAALAARAPVFSGGRYRSAIDDISGRPLPASEIPPATALALQRLSDEGALELTAPGDAPAHGLPFGPPDRVAFVTRCSPGR